MRQGVAAESLQAGGIRIETELAVAERDLASQVIPLDVVACDQRVAVNCLK